MCSNHFKSHFSKACLYNTIQVITTDIIASLVGGPLSVTPVNIMSGFKKCGAYPLNPGAISDRQIVLNPPLSRSQSEEILSKKPSRKTPFLRPSHVKNMLSIRPDMKKAMVYQVIPITWHGCEYIILTAPGGCWLQFICKYCRLCKFKPQCTATSTPTPNPVTSATT